MNISIINRHAPLPWEVTQLAEAARAAGNTVDIFDIADVNDIKKVQASLGDLVIWRSSTTVETLSMPGLGRAVISLYANDRFVINKAICTKPQLAQKLFQQNLIASTTSVSTIPTFHFSSEEGLVQALQRNELTFPLICKPNYGHQGANVRKLDSLDQVRAHAPVWEEVIWQPFLPNQGDFRVLMLGGVMLGAIKRVATAGEYLNNVSQLTSHAEAVQDPHVLSILRSMANSIVSATGLAFCGVDILQSDTDGHYYFLEVNSSPQWRGFQHITKINVAQAVLGYGQAMIESQTTLKPAAVKHYYLDRLSLLPPHKQFHLMSRLWLWGHDEQAGQFLQNHRSLFLNEASAGRGDHPFLLPLPAIQAKLRRQPHRETIFKKYPDLLKFHHYLAYVLFADIVYGEKIMATPPHSLPLATYYDALCAAPLEVMQLSTYAINYLYWVRRYVPNMVSEVKLSEFLHEAIMALSPQQHPEELLYVLTHIIINESVFYSQAVAPSSTILHLITKAEAVVKQHYHQLSLDCKLEFVICAKLCEYTSPLIDVIMNEADASRSPLGVFVVNMFNMYHASNRKSLDNVEHSNALYLMAHTPRTTSGAALT